MAYDLNLANRIKARLAAEPAYVEKKMFGGTCYMLNGHLACGVHKDGLIVRLGSGDYVAAQGQPHTHPFDLTGRPMTGWLVVDPAGIAADTDLHAWIARALAFAYTLPPK